MQMALDIAPIRFGTFHLPSLFVNEGNYTIVTRDGMLNNEYYRKPTLFSAVYLTLNMDIFATDFNSVLSS